MDEEKNLQVNVNMSNTPELVDMLDAMCESDEQTRSGFMRKLIRMEFQRRTGALVPAKIISAAPSSTIAKPAVRKSSVSKPLSKVLSA